MCIDQSELRKLHWPFAQWSEQDYGYFPYMEEREVLEPGQVVCAEQTVADWLT